MWKGSSIDHPHIFGLLAQSAERNAVTFKLNADTFRSRVQASYKPFPFRM